MAQIGELITAEALGKLITYQRGKYKLELEIIAEMKLPKRDWPAISYDPFIEIEPVEEIDKIMRQTPRRGQE